MQIFLKKTCHKLSVFIFSILLQGAVKKLIFGAGDVKKLETMKKQMKLEAFKK